ncbi:HAD family hydrolase [uncultured Thiohalocapsa sp.]|uniref:HAD family hydrolase n=1 Tax=uncultured Thiohalocapsa sp. TaxID=768990 RepID=UPI0025E03130|nr:HAD family hydrolase [uncultured Thiohalocapsa sp.]
MPVHTPANAQPAPTPPSGLVRLITIDLDDTLWPCGPVIQAAEEALHAWLAEQAPRLTARFDAQALRGHRQTLMAARPELAHDLTQVRLLSLRALLAELDYDIALADAAMDLFRRHRNRVQPYADVAPVLARLRERHRLVAVTNGNAEVHQTPLRDAFHRTLTAAEAGAAKPDPAIFELAMDWAGVTPAQTLHVGDDPVRDVEAARRLGIAAVWINRDNQPWPDDLPPPLLAVDNLHGLARWLETAVGPAEHETS